ncbi:hypothetical protein PR202_gb03737 [Eleusine coracana subsp. coracana]|uniref:BRX domain-containing protein n=1 Tax=Eleusine coracana subsp. coracana TaxID=191504 RepID=A0AAV5E2I9_ELECO|nr:hypothetical protein PR202_gb03737 [Eleusine coracana subsp. coracana]
MSDASSDLGGIRAGPVERDIEQAITALKKGAYLLKYGRRGKPKFCPFRLSNDESVLIWFSGKEEKHLKLSHVSRIIPGQRTAIFQRYPRPEKECQSFSLISHDRSLDIDGSENYRLRTPYGSPPKNGLEKAFSDVMLYAAPPKGFFPSDSNAGSVHSMSSGHSDNTNGHPRGIPMDAFRVSYSSAVSSSSHGSGHDDGDALGDVFIWGEGTGEGTLGGGGSRVGSSSGAKMDCLVPKPLEFAVRLDVQNISCGGRHAALVTKQGEIYSWGEESGGRLGHGVDCDVSQPKLIDALSHMNIELVACGEYHTCAVTLSGDLYTWGDGAFKFGLLGHGNDVSHWVPKRVNGPLEGIHVSSISCGPWHTALVTSAGQLFTFGDGSFGVLGHGDRESTTVPREVESLKGLRTVRAACGVWHTAAVVEVMVGNSSSSNCSSGKIFTWGDGDKGRLGHGDKEPRLVPTCVAALVEYNFCQVASGHCLTVALTTSGHVYTMGSAVYGQLGNPQADGMLPVRVEGKLHKNFVEEISCGAYHVAVLTSRTEVYTWGKGANGRLGHGDTDDRNAPTLVEALKDKQVRSVVCGINFTAAICIHKWVSGVDQSISKKSMKASLAPNPNKPYRVCDSCYNKLTKGQEADMHSSAKRGATVQGFNDTIEDELETRSNAQLSRATSPISRRASPPRSRTPTPTLGGLTSPRVVANDGKPTNEALSQEVLTLRSQLESITRKSQLLEVELERAKKQLKEAVSIAGEETAKCKAAKEVIKSLTAQLKGMAERLPGGAAKNNKLPPLPGIYIPSDIESLATESLGSPSSSGEQTTNGHTGLLASNGPSSIRNKTGHPEVGKNGTRLPDTESCQEAEWVEQDEPGVYITLTALPGGARDLKRVRFSRKRFSETQAEQWWQENRTRVYKQYNVRVADKSTTSADTDIASH